MACRSDLVRNGCGMSLRHFSRSLKVWKNARCAHSLIRKKPRPGTRGKRWGVVQGNLLKKEQARAQFIHDLFTSLQKKGEIERHSEAYRACEQALRKTRCGMSLRQFSRLLRKWSENPCPGAVMRKRSGTSFSDKDCLDVVKYAHERGISIQAAKAAIRSKGTGKVPSYATIRLRFPWAGELVASAQKHSRLAQHLSSEGRRKENHD